MDTPLLETPVSGSPCRWHLSAPESYVLMEGRRASGVESFRKGLLELITRGVLRMEKCGPPHSTTFLVAGARSSQVHATAGPLVSIWQLCDRIGDVRGTGVDVAALGKAARRLRRPLKGFTKHTVLPSLEGRGLYRQEEYLALGLFPWTRYAETTAGAAARRELAALMDTVERKFDAAAREDSRQALALVAILGSAVLLMTPLLPELARLSRELAPVLAKELEFTLSAGNGFTDLDPGALRDLDGALDSVGDIADGGGWGDGDSGGWGDGDGGD
jgi:hypothetical protein